LGKTSITNAQAKINYKPSEQNICNHTTKIINDGNKKYIISYKEL